MGIGYTIFFSFLIGFGLTLVISFWLDKLGGGFGCLGLVITFLLAAAAMFLFITYAPMNIKLIATYIGLGIVGLSLLVVWLS